MDKGQLCCGLDHSNSSMSTLMALSVLSGSLAPSSLVYPLSLAPIHLQLTLQIPICNPAGPHSRRLRASMAQVWALLLSFSLTGSGDLAQAFAHSISHLFGGLSDSDPLGLL